MVVLIGTLRERLCSQFWFLVPGWSKGFITSFTSATTDRCLLLVSKAQTPSALGVLGVTFNFQSFSEKQTKPGKTAEKIV